MAERRMFAKTIIDSDAFLDMPLSTQALYFHLAMRGDDDGFVNNPKKIMRMIGSTQNEMELLIAKKFIIVFDSGVVVIKHWKIHNYIRSDRYKPTVYTKEWAKLVEKDNKGYSLSTECLPSGIPVGDAGKDRLGKESIDKNNIEQFFEQTWSKYRRKRGKGDISAKVKAERYKLGDEFIRCIERYNNETRSKETQYLQYGSTFWNSGYVDYLDENYVDETEKGVSNETRFDDSGWAM